MESSAVDLKFNSDLAATFIKTEIILIIWYILRSYVYVSLFFFPFDLHNSSGPGKLSPFYKDDWGQIMGAHFPEMGLLREMKTLQQGSRSILDHGNKYLLNTYSA